MDVKDSTGVPFVSVVWKDAWADAVASVTLKDVHETHKPEIIISKGWLLLQDAEGLSIASEYCADGSYRGRSFIPAGMVISIEPISLTKRRQRKSRDKSKDNLELQPRVGTSPVPDSDNKAG